MVELIRLFTKRNPVLLNQDSINSFGIQSHPDNHQSLRFKNWLSLCRSNNIDALKNDMYKFLQSKESIKSIEELGGEWSKIILSFFAAGDQLTKERVYEIIRSADIDRLFICDKNAFSLQFTAIADTLLSLTYLKNLGHKDNIDYQSVLKVMAYTERCFTFKFRLPELNILRYFEKPILLPSPFFKVDPQESTTTIDSRFSYLQVQNQQDEKEQIKGCISSNCTCHENNDCVKQSESCARPRIDLIDLMVVKTYTKRYEAGDISYIKNVLDGETLATQYRELNRMETLTENETDIRQFEEKYLQTEDKTSLNKEAEDILKTDKGADAGLTTNSSFGYSAMAEGIGYKFDFGTNSTTNLSFNQSKTISNKIVQDYSQDIIARATKQMEQKVRSLSTEKKLHETEEKNKHIFINQTGENINGQYLFVNKVSRAQVYNYGRYPVIDLILPEPAVLYKRLLNKEFEKPEPVLEIKSPEEITDKNFIDLISKYKIKEYDSPPKMTDAVHFTFNINGYGYSNHTYIENMSVNIPAGFEAVSMKINSHNLDSFENPYYTILIIGGKEVYIKNTGDLLTNTLPNLAGNQAVTGNSFNLQNIQIDLVIDCVLSQELRIKWQQSIFNKIVEEFEKELAAYNQEKTDFEAKEDSEKNKRYNKNPFINRETEKAELKRMAISYISCQFFDKFNSMKNRVEPCGYPQMNIKEAEEEGKFIQFFEQAFNWNLVTYIFYPYFWGKKCSWGKNLAEEAGDLIFEKFLQAGSCHVQIPIRPTHWALVQHFIDTGEIWDAAGNVPLPNDPYYVSLAQEIKEQFQNFNAEREGTIDASNSANSATVILQGTQQYWDTSLNTINTANRLADIDREILIDYKTYRIIDIAETTPASVNHDTWVITLERNYEGATQPNLKWSTGAVYIGAPWEFTTPTNLIFLREKSKCLPSYPLPECK